jgi:hypothetical protein
MLLKSLNELRAAYIVFITFRVTREHTFISGKTRQQQAVKFASARQVMGHGTKEKDTKKTS